MTDDEIRDALERLAARNFPKTIRMPREAAETDEYDREGWGHGFRLKPVVSESEVAAFERLHNVRLPPDYRHFITALGSGGAGPSLGGFEQFGMYNGNSPYDEDILNSLSEPFDEEAAEHRKFKLHFLKRAD
jgi:hypothetical protein